MGKFENDKKNSMIRNKSIHAKSNRTENSKKHTGMRVLMLCIMVAGILLFPAAGSLAQEVDDALGQTSTVQSTNLEYSNETTGYVAKVEDSAQLLSQEQQAALLEVMKDITAYGNVAFHSTNSNQSSAEYYARQYYYSQFGENSGTIFLIDMSNRMLYIYSDGAVYRIITKAKANTITDNIYQYATNGDYFTCAALAFSQEVTLLEGGRISQPMKYASNLLLALVLALLINYGVVRMTSDTKKPSDEEILTGLIAKQQLLDFKADKTHTDRVYSPRSSGGGSGGGGGGGGGGGHSF